MINVAIVEDDIREAEKIKSNLSAFSEKYGTHFNVEHYDKAETFLNFYKTKYDIVFMDIELGGMDGMRAAQKLRALDTVVVLIFVTNMRQFACDGYAVDALDFIVKPIMPVRFESVIRRACVRISQDKSPSEIAIRTVNGVQRVNKSDILYVEIQQHKVILHTAENEYSYWGTMKKIKEEFPEDSFALCNSCYLVNLRYVKLVEEDYVTVLTENLKISRPKKKPFMAALMKYLGEH